MADLAGRAWRDKLEGDEHDENMGVGECRGHIVKLRCGSDTQLGRWCVVYITIQVTGDRVGQDYRSIPT
jgi:hypothetical protein